MSRRLATLTIFRKGGQPAAPTTLTATGKVPVLASDGGRAPFMKELISAIKASNLVFVSQDTDSGVIKCETGGITRHSWSGENITIEVSEANEGPIAMFRSKGKPSGAIRLSYATNAMKYVEEVLRHVSVPVK